MPAKGAGTVTFQPGEVLFWEGEPGHLAYIIEDGRVEVVKRAPGGEDRILAIVGPGEVVGEMSLIDEEPRIATVRAIDETVCRAVAADEFRAQLAGVDPAIRKLLEKFVALARDYDNERTYGLPLRRPKPPQ